MKQKTCLFGNSQAILGYPVYLLVALVVTAAVLAVFVQSALYITADAEEHMVASELHKIVTEAQNMYEYADEGTLVTVHLDLPQSLAFAVFGDAPQSGWKQPTTIVRSQDETCNQYYYVMRTGQTKMFHIPAKFCSSSFDEIALLQPGSMDLVLELKKNTEGVSYVQIT